MRYHMKNIFTFQIFSKKICIVYQCISWSAPCVLLTLLGLRWLTYADYVSYNFYLILLIKLTRQHVFDRGGWIIFQSKSIKNCCLLNFILFFPISCIVSTCYVYYYCIWLGFSQLFSCFFSEFHLFSKGSVTRCDSSLGSLFFQCTSFRAHASSFWLTITTTM